MAVWRFFDYVELTKRNKIREWLDALPEGDRARIDSRLLMMAALPSWPEKWVSKYRCSGDLYEFRITGKGVQYRPLGTYYGAKQYVILAGAIEKGDKVPKSDIDVALARLSNLERNDSHAVPHEFGSPDAMERDEE
jgi:phage-related protein